MLPTWMNGLTPELVEKAQRELGETPEVQAKALLDLKELINDNPDFNCLKEDTFLIRFLRSKKYDVLRTYKVLQNYYAFKEKYPGRMSENILDILEMNHFLIPPERAADGAGIVVVFIGQLEFEKYSPDEYFNAFMVCLEISIEFEANQVCGAHLIIDYKGISIKKIRQFATPKFISLVAKGIENCWPYRLKTCHVLNEPFYFSIAYNIIYPMLSKKLKERIFFHGSNTTNLHQSFSKDNLPKQIRGGLGPEAFVDFRNNVISKQLEIERLNKYSFHRQNTTPAKKHSTCRLEENETNYQTNAAMPKVST